MKIVIHQPEYLPWLGFFDRIANCDLFVALDTVQFQRGFINRNKLKCPTGWQWMNVPIIHKFHRKDIRTVKINNQANWGEENWKALLYNYGKAPFFQNYAELFSRVFNKKWSYISDLDIYLIKKILEILKIKTPVVKSSSLKPRGKSTDLLIDICQKVGADNYLSGPGGKLYMEPGKFKRANIKVTFQNFKHPVYSQQFDNFIPQLSIVDLLFNLGPESGKILQR